MNIQFLGAAEITSGACYLVRSGDQQVLIDCGMFHGPEELKQRNYGDFPFDPSEIDAVLLTHAHIDHSGLLPKLVKHGFAGPIYATAVTVDLCEIMLADSGYIQESEVERLNRRRSRRGQELLTPIYTVADVDIAMKQFKRMVYDEEVQILPTMRARFRDAGHILGAAIVELWVTEGEETTKVVFSGDLGNLDQPIVQDPTFIAETDILVIESTYGTRHHENRGDRLEHLAEVVNSTMKRGGNLLIPAFALGRTQDILYSLRVLQDEGRIPSLNIYIDSPLATKATEVFQKHARVFDYETRTMIRDGRSPFEAPNVHYTESVQESMRLNSVSGGLVIISASGMADAGRIKHHLKHNLWRKPAGVLFVGYQAQGTLGRRLQDGAKEVRIHGEMVRVAASIETIPGFSAHADQGALLHWLRRFRHIGRVFVTHGEKESCHGFAELVRGELGVPVVVPKLDESFDFRGADTVSVWDSQYQDFYVDDFAGVVQVANGAETEFRGAYGLAQRRYQIENHFYTLFNLGSARHFFAQVALARLVEQGELAAGRVGPWSAEPVWEDKIRELLPDQDPWEVVTREVLEPCELHQSSYYYLDQAPALAATGYTTTRTGTTVENIYAILEEGLKPQLFCTAHDLKRFWNTLAQGTFLPLETVQELLVPYGDSAKKPTFYTIEGKAPGVHVLLGGDLTTPTSIIVLSNGEVAVRFVFDQLVKYRSKGR